MSEFSEYRYHSAQPVHDDLYLWQAVERELLSRVPKKGSIIELGCGNGLNARKMSALGFSVTATDASVSAIECAGSNSDSIRFETASVYDPLHERYGVFDCVVTLDVIEHLYAPRALARLAFNLLKPGGVAMISTPYHGWLKNTLIAATNRFDAHADPLWDNGHIKLFSRATIRALLGEAGFEELSLQRLGRIPVLAKSMLIVVQRPC
jgi:2-polyprenyl-6-hydroxyphenyl methylase/3-demethylubiquinone-9 3-methyltransferase